MKVAIIVVSCLISMALAQYPPKPAYGGGVPVLPPLGAAAKHPRYGSHGYSDKKHGDDYVIARRYESSTRGPSGIDSAYAYQVDGQTVQVARFDAHQKGNGYGKH